jgi:tRNA modification GTPase
LLGDPIWAVATAAGASARGVIRISGPDAFAAAARVVRPGPEVRRGAGPATVEVLGFAVPALLLTMPGPGSFTGEDVVELHLPGAPFLLESVGAALDPRARRAAPGEFSRRAFEHGRISLAEAEAVLDLIHATDLDEAGRAAATLRGGLRAAVAALRARIDDTRALLEAGLDFAEEETGAVDPSAWVPDLDAVLAELGALRSALPHGAPAGDLVLLGPANAGKSTLCNALLGRDEVLVSPRAGTTRDVLAVEIAPGLRLLDAPGDLDPADPGEPGGGSDPDREALAHRDRLVAATAAAALLVLDPAQEPQRLPAAGRLPVLAVVLTHADLAAGRREPPGLPPGVPVFHVDGLGGAGIEELRAFLLRRAVRGPDGRGVRVDAALGRARDAVARARTAGAAELAAVELQDALAALDEVDGRSTPEDVLDRIFARFCLGK